MHNSFKITQSQTKLPMNPPEFDFSQKSRRKVMIFDENEFQNDQSNHNVFKEVLVREIKDNIDQVKDELMQSFESIMREIKQNSQKYK